MTAEAAVGPMLVVIVLAFAQLVVEDAGVLGDDAVQEAVELLGVDAMGSLKRGRSSTRGGFRGPSTTTPQSAWERSSTAHRTSEPRGLDHSITHG
ncbi:hypothetical protein OG948_37695 (plasmid) [Embleya sp. NBC_00888]|uniref:hypothetical protein n=1 Tax=Embleya sp. NBC_00888 TaxID=2975960 RepID=UPI00386B511C|nr:hypothetical protein OG948_37695 [Embleya sp. NBC_00888]